MCSCTHLLFLRLRPTVPEVILLGDGIPLIDHADRVSDAFDSPCWLFEALSAARNLQASGAGHMLCLPGPLESHRRALFGADSLQLGPAFGAGKLPLRRVWTN